MHQVFFELAVVFSNGLEMLGFEILRSLQLVELGFFEVQPVNPVLHQENVLVQVFTGLVQVKLLSALVCFEAFAGWVDQRRVTQAPD